MTVHYKQGDPSEGFNATVAVLTCPDKCPRNRICRQNICLCPEGTTGPDCNDLLCPNNCTADLKQGSCDKVKYHLWHYWMFTVFKCLKLHSLSAISPMGSKFVWQVVAPENFQVERSLVYGISQYITVYIIECIDNLFQSVQNQFSLEKPSYNILVLTAPALNYNVAREKTIYSIAWLSCAKRTQIQI